MQPVQSVGPKPLMQMGVKHINTHKIMKETIKWYKVKCSFYQQEFGIRNWRDVLDFMSRHVGFDIEIKGQTTERFEGVDAYYEHNQFHKIK